MMRLTPQFLLEALIVGLVFAAVMAGVAAVLPLRTLLRTAVAGFLAGAAGHLAFELFGANAWYCRRGNACQQ